MPGVLERFVRALKPGGIWYLSFKHGETERVEGGRLFNDQTESMLEKQLGQFGELEAIEMWRTADQRPGRLNETWLNCTVRRVVGPI
jgi:hypothetical protein